MGGLCKERLVVSLYYLIIINTYLPRDINWNTPRRKTGLTELKKSFTTLTKLVFALKY